MLIEDIVFEFTLRVNFEIIVMMKNEHNGARNIHIYKKCLYECNGKIAITNENITVMVISKLNFLSNFLKF